jgi:heme-degrading monooxygenase HmoA
MSLRPAVAFAILCAALPVLIAALPHREPSAGEPGHLIGRVWKGRTSAARADEYQRYLNANGISTILATKGNRGVTVMRRQVGDAVEFTVLSVWESMEAVRDFAGADYRKAVILPRDREFLLSVEPEVEHFEIVREQRK